MKKTPDTTGKITRHSGKHEPYNESTARPNAVVQKITRKRRCQVKHTRRMEELRKMASLQERVIHRMLDKSIEEPAPPERPQLRLVK